MVHEQDEHSHKQDEGCNHFDMILQKSLLAQNLKKLYDSLLETGTVKILVNGWISLNYSFPHKVHRHASARSLVDAQFFNNYYKLIKPYHTFLLFGHKEKDQIIK